MKCIQCWLVRFAEIADTCSTCKRDFDLEGETRRDSPSLDPTKHLYHEIAAVFNLGRSLRKYEPAPGCPCIRCTGVIPPSPDLSRKLSFDDTNVDRARDRPIVRVLELLGCEPVRRGNRWKAKCPLHDDTNPSMSIDEKKNLWYCFACSEGGDQIELWMRARRVKFQEAVKALT